MNQFRSALKEKSSILTQLGARVGPAESFPSYSRKTRDATVSMSSSALSSSSNFPSANSESEVSAIAAITSAYADSDLESDSGSEDGSSEDDSEESQDEDVMQGQAQPVSHPNVS